MLERPTRPASHPPAGRPVALVRANPPTLSFYRWLYERIGADFPWTARRLMTAAELTAVIAAPAVEVHAPLVPGVPAGYGELDRPASTDAAHPASFGLHP